MKGNPQKSVVLLMILLMGLLPLQGIFAGLGNIDQQMPMSHQMAASQAMPADCEHCDTDNHCDGQDCQSNHCTSSTPAIVSTTLQLEGGDFTTEKSTISSGFVFRNSSSLFRPPIS